MDGVSDAVVTALAAADALAELQRPLGGKGRSLRKYLKEVPMGGADEVDDAIIFAQCWAAAFAYLEAKEKLSSSGPAEDQ